MNINNINLREIFVDIFCISAPLYYISITKDVTGIFNGIITLVVYFGILAGIIYLTYDIIKRIVCSDKEEK